MPNPAPALVLSLSLVLAALPAAAVPPATGAVIEDVTASPLPSLPGETTAKVNVRFGPSKTAKSVTTLPAGATVAVLGRADTDPQWLRIRFPDQGAAWVGVQVLRDAGNGYWQVVRDDSRARDDATPGANIIAQLARGEMLPDRGQRVGAFVRVGLPNAVAYVHADFVKLIGAPVAAAPGGQPPAIAQNPVNPPVVPGAPVDLGDIDRKRREQIARASQLWSLVQGTYTDFRKSVQLNIENALNRDWDGLLTQLTEVKTIHPDPNVRFAAVELLKRVGDVRTAAEEFRRQKPTAAGPVVPVPQPGPTPVVPPVAPPVAVPELPPVPTVAANPAFAAEGFLVRRDVTKLGVEFAIMNRDGAVVAFAKASPTANAGSAALSEYCDRTVGLKGSSEPTDPAVTGEAKPVPLVLVTEIVLLNW